MVIVAGAPSLWLDQLGALPTRPALQGELETDVAIVGGGFTGLWTAYYLAQLDPTLQITVLERNHVGFGASGRNGGWAVGELAAGVEKYAARSSLDAARRLTRELFAAVDEIGRVITAEGIDCGYAKGGNIRLARNRFQRDRQIEEVEHHLELGFAEDDLRLLSAPEAEAMCAATAVHGGIFFAHCAAVDPARLVAGLATACEALGVSILERSPIEAIETGRVVGESGTVRAGMVVMATEGYTRDLAGRRRDLVPTYSRMLATAPLTADQWAEIGLDHRPTFSDDRYMVIYGQRTEDGRIAFGGRGVPYLFGSRIDPACEVRADSHRLVHEALVDLFPMLADVEITHRWGGVLGVPRDWTPFVHADLAAGFAAAGGYVGEGVAAANAAGRTLAELITRTDSARTDLPWVGPLPRRWEPEPLRWIGIRGSRRIMASADAREARGREAKLAVRVSRWLRGS